MLEAYLSQKPGIKPTKIKILRQFGTAQNALRHYSQLSQALGVKVGDRVWRDLLDIRLSRPFDDEPPRFLGCSNIAEARWCHLKAIFKCIEEEHMFKAAYDEDVPTQGVTPTVQDYNRMLEQKKGIGTTEKRFLDWEKEKQQLVAEGFADLDPKWRGAIVESFHAEQYPTIRFHFEFMDKVVLGIPDGITGEFCYEFKSTRNQFLYEFVLPVARCQANLYAYFLKRPYIRVQVHILETDEIKTVMQEANYSRAEADLTEIVELLSGKRKPIPPKPWKCNTCKFATRCPGCGSRRS